MDKIASFTIDHSRILPGIYVSRTDITPSGDVLTTYDLRITAPNREPALTGQTIHAIEHLAATFLRNHPQWKEKVVYFGPMGCLTGCYLILQGSYRPEELVGLLKETFQFIARYEGDIPGASPRDCGNYTFMDLEGARKAAEKYLREVLLHPETERFNYPS